MISSFIRTVLLYTTAFFATVFLGFAVIIAALNIWLLYQFAVGL